MKYPTILEGGIARAFSGIRKLFTRQSGSDDMITWVPESDRTLGTKHITQNGIYRASDDGYYAYSSVTVSVPTDTGVTGEGEDGEQHYVAPDSDTGELVDEVIPSSIVVETPPTNQYGIYKDAQAIGKDGMVVKAYLASGELYEGMGIEDGTVPNAEITLVPGNAAYDESTDQPGGTTSTLDTSPIEQPIPNGVSQLYNYHHPTQVVYKITAFGDAVYTVGIPNQSNFWVIVSALSSSGGVTIENMVEGTSQTVNASSSYTTDIGDGYYGAMNVSTGIAFNIVVDDRTIRAALPSSLNTRINIAATMLHGEKIPAGSRQTITAEWPRVGDGAVLSDTFEILVAPPIYGGGEA